ncbi:MAG: AI-2E family transporter [Streptococcaceae bacterium]|jgi:predicted PurR-regulated permease PerM|nr:AI-2E family transporter [Streptococcaceae bacterium]
MIEKYKQSKLLFWTVELVLIALLIFISTKIDFLFSPIGTFFATLFQPVLIGGFLYYLLNPLVTVFEEKLKLKRVIGIIIVFILLIGILVLTILNFLPNLISQLTDLAISLPDSIKDVQKWAIGLEKYKIFKNIDIEAMIKTIDFSWGDIATKTLTGVALSLSSIFNFFTQALVLLGTIPFVLFYMLKDGEKIPSKITHILPEKHRENVLDLLEKMNQTIANYISGQAIQCLFVFVMMLVGYLVLGVEYGFLFAVVAGLCNLIPYIGPFFGIAPALLATVFTEPMKALVIIIFVVIVQQINGSFIYPNVIGKSLKIHPLTIILILLVGGNLAGVLGIFLAVPVFAIGKTILTFLLEMYKVRKR